MDTTPEPSLDARLRLLERRLRTTRVLALGALILAVGMGAVALWPRAELRVQRLVVEDGAGVERASLGLGRVGVPDFFMGGEHQGEGVALVLNDALGRVRQVVGVGGGREDAPVLTQLDDAGRSVASISSLPAGGTGLRLGADHEVALQVTPASKDGHEGRASLVVASQAAVVSLEVSELASLQVRNGARGRFELTAFDDPSGSVALDLASDSQSVRMSVANRDDALGALATLKLEDRVTRSSILMGLFSGRPSLHATEQDKPAWRLSE